MRGQAYNALHTPLVGCPCRPAGVLTLKYAEVKPDHLSMLLMGLNAYPEAMFSSKLQRLLLECCVHMPLAPFEVCFGSGCLCVGATCFVSAAAYGCYRCLPHARSCCTAPAAGALSNLFMVLGVCVSVPCVSCQRQQPGACRAQGLTAPGCRWLHARQELGVACFHWSPLLPVPLAGMPHGALLRQAPVLHHA